MASCSDYFRSMFTSGMKESTQSSIELKGVSSRGLEKVIEIIYTSHTSFESHTDMFEVISAATHLQCLLVIDYCEKNFLSRITCQNFNYFIQMAKLYRMANALKQIDLFIMNNLAQIINQQNTKANYFRPRFYEDYETNDPDENAGLKSLTYEQLLKCLKSNELRLKEIDLFLLTWQWINQTILYPNQKLTKSLIKKKKFNQKPTYLEQNPKRKLEIIRNLMRHVRFALITPSDLVNKVQLVNKIMIDDKYLRNLVIKALNYHVLPNIQSRHKAESAEACFNINIRSPVKSILMIGGREISPYPSLHDNCSILNEYCQKSDEHDEATTKTSSKSSSTNIRRMSLTSLPNMLSHMQCVVVESNFLYVIGGCTSQCAHGESAINTMYRYDPRLNTWINVSSMVDKRAYFYACKLDVKLSCNSEDSTPVKEYIYAIGGKNKDGALSSVERYDLDSNTWTFTQQLPSSCYAHAGCVLDNKVYFSGKLSFFFSKIQIE